VEERVGDDDEEDDEGGIDYSGWGADGRAWQRPAKVKEGEEGVASQRTQGSKAEKGTSGFESDSGQRARDLLPSCFSLIEVRQRF
jgi:hypothetical protein